MNHEELERRRQLDELLRQHEQRVSGQAPTPAPEAKPTDDEDDALISESTKQALKGAASKAKDLSKAGLAEMIEKTKLARDQLKEASKILAAPRPVVPLPPAPELLPPFEPKPVKMVWPTMRLFGAGELSVIAASAWALVGIGLFVTHAPSPSVPEPTPVIEVPVESAVVPSVAQSVATEIEEVALAPAVPAAPVAPPRVAEAPVVTPEPANKIPASAPPARTKPQPKPAPEVDDQWTEDANEELDQWERVLRSE